MKKMLILICLAILLMSLLLISGCVESQSDPCKSAFEECNYACGEGWFNGLCKSGCTDKYNKCKGGR